MSPSEYDTSNITVLTMPEAIRKRPRMYIGSLDMKGKKYLILQTIDSYIIKEDSFVSFIITLKQGDFIEICFDEYGADVDFETAFNNVYWFDALKSLNQFLEIRTAKGIQIFERGNLLSEDPNPIYVKKNTILFKLDNEIFDNISIFYEALFQPLKERAILNNNLSILYKDEREPQLKQNYFYYEEGVKSYMPEFELNGFSEQGQTFYFDETREEISYEFGFFWDGYLQDNILISFVNNDKLRHHGSLTDGIIGGILATAKKLVDYHLESSEHFNEGDKFSFSKKQVVHGLRLFASVKMKSPHFGGSTKEKLNEHIVYVDAKKMVFERLYAHFTTPEAAKPDGYWSELDGFLSRFRKY
jgi:DNA gyrase/topoisomerase IV subunit B